LALVFALRLLALALRLLALAFRLGLDLGLGLETPGLVNIPAKNPPHVYDRAEFSRAISDGKTMRMEILPENWTLASCLSRSLKVIEPTRIVPMSS